MPRKPKRETVDVGSAPAEMTAILAHYLGRTAEAKGFVILVETAGGGYEVKMTSTTNVAERLGRLELIREAVLEEMEE